MRGGTSRGPFFLDSDLPGDVEQRDKILLAVMGSPDKRQIDGLGGSNPLTSKVGIVGKGHDEGIDINFLFAQVMVDQAIVDTTPNCGNMLAAAVPFALEVGLVKSQGNTSTFRVLTLNVLFKHTGIFIIIFSFVYFYTTCTELCVLLHKHALNSYKGIGSCTIIFYIPI